MQNTLQDLNNYLFEAIERVGDDDLTEEQLEKETKKAETIVKIGQAIIGKCTGAKYRQESTICVDYRKKGRHK